VGLKHVRFQSFTAVVTQVSRCDNVSGQRNDAIFKEQTVQDILTLEDHIVNRVTLRIIIRAVVQNAAENSTLSKYRMAPQYDPSVNCKVITITITIIIIIMYS
jgi:hypothetical protein